MQFTRRKERTNERTKYSRGAPEEQKEDDEETEDKKAAATVEVDDKKEAGTKVSFSSLYCQVTINPPFNHLQHSSSA
jgi:hypothetical protein